jgi:hypothetical protein
MPYLKVDFEALNALGHFLDGRPNLCLNAFLTRITMSDTYLTRIQGLIKTLCLPLLSIHGLSASAQDMVNRSGNRHVSLFVVFGYRH